MNIESLGIVTLIFGMRRHLFLLGDADIVGIGRLRDGSGVRALMHAKAIARLFADIFNAQDVIAFQTLVGGGVVVVAVENPAPLAPICFRLAAHSTK